MQTEMENSSYLKCPSKNIKKLYENNNILKHIFRTTALTLYLASFQNLLLTAYFLTRSVSCIYFFCAVLADPVYFDQKKIRI
jgi:hypothetical protein